MTARCTITTAPGESCGSEAIVSWTNSRGETFAECADHASGPAPAPAPVGAGMVGRHVIVHCFTWPVRCRIVSVGRVNAQVVGHMANGREVRREVRIADIESGNVPFV